MEEMKSRQNLTAWAIVAIIGLLGLNAYQWFSNSQLKKTVVAKERQTEDLAKVQAQLDLDYTAALESIETLRGDNKELNDLIDSQKKELEAQKAKVSDLIYTKRDLVKAKEELSKLNSKVSQMVAEINKLKEDNQILTTENTQLVSQNQVLSSDLAIEKTQKEELALAKATLANEKESLSKNNEALSTKVDMANAIKINWMEVKGFEIEKNGKLDEKSKGKDIDLVRFCLKTETNMITAAGKKKFFIRMIEPTGETVAFENSGAGVLTNKLDNSQIRFTTSGEVDYQNKDTNACIDWTVNQPLAKGIYGVEIYNNGFLVGKGSYNVK